MDPKALYWTAALANMVVLVAFALRGVRQVRAGRVDAHRRSMTIACSLVVAFLASYVAKLAFLGREQLSAWEPFYLHTLRFHETCVLVMVLGGLVALGRAAILRRTRRVTHDPADPAPSPSTLRWHHRAGWTAVAASILAVLSAAVVLVGMYGRVGG